MTSEEIGEHFGKALQHYYDEEGLDLIDVLADAMHWCRLSGVDFDEALQQARMHFQIETAEEGAS